MTKQEIERVVLDVLAGIAPEIEPGDIEPETNFRDQFDFDSMDLHNFIIGLCEALKIEVPEADYPELASLAGCVSYLTAKIKGKH